MRLELVKQYAPYIFFDEKEPFYPLYIGYSFITNTSKSPSFKRQINFSNTELKYVIEYELYWDFDIQHLYELEHVWVYIDKKGNVIDCEASFHGKWFRNLKRDRSNLLDGTHVKIYSQPGKHAFSPIPELFELIPDVESATYEDVGIDGLIVTDVGEGLYETSSEINSMIREYMQKFKFRPTFEYVKYEYPESIFIEWSELKLKIPELIKEKLTEIEREIKGKRKGDS